MKYTYAEIRYMLKISAIVFLFQEIPDMRSAWKFRNLKKKKKIKKKKKENLEIFEHKGRQKNNGISSKGEKKTVAKQVKVSFWCRSGGDYFLVYYQIQEGKGEQKCL